MSQSGVVTSCHRSTEKEKNSKNGRKFVTVAAIADTFQIINRS